MVMLRPSHWSLPFRDWSRCPADLCFGLEGLWVERTEQILRKQLQLEFGPEDAETAPWKEGSFCLCFFLCICFWLCYTVTLFINLVVFCYYSSRIWVGLHSAHPFLLLDQQWAAVWRRRSTSSTRSMRRWMHSTALRWPGQEQGRLRIRETPKKPRKELSN